MQIDTTNKGFCDNITIVKRITDITWVHVYSTANAHKYKVGGKCKCLGGKKLILTCKCSYVLVAQHT